LLGAVVVRVRCLLQEDAAVIIKLFLLYFVLNKYFLDILECTRFISDECRMERVGAVAEVFGVLYCQLRLMFLGLLLGLFLGSCLGRRKRWMAKAGVGVANIVVQDESVLDGDIIGAGLL
jgi:hypothetical protein